MKVCPKCNRTFPDEGQKFCTFDGGLLIAQPAFDPNATIRATSTDLSQVAPPSEKTTSRELPDPNATIAESYAATVALPRNTGPTGGSPTTADFSTTPPPPLASPPQSAQTPPQTPPPPVSAELPSAEQDPMMRTLLAQGPAASSQLPPLPATGVAPPPAKKKSKLPWIIAALVLVLLLGGGGLVAAFFVVVKPMLEKNVARQAQSETTPTTTTVATPTPEVKASVEPTPADSFVPPPGTVQFSNSKATLDGKLAEHYFDFSFYYPKSWAKDPKAGVPGASNFVLVERSEKNFPLESFAVGWYTSTGTFIGDLKSYPKRVEEFSAALAKQFPEYRKVSEGPTQIDSMQGYEFRWEGLSSGTEKGDVRLWGRVVFLPTGTEGDTAGATLTMFATSLATELTGLNDLGAKGEMPVILESFRFGKQK